MFTRLGRGTQQRLFFSPQECGTDDLCKHVRAACMYNVARRRATLCVHPDVLGALRLCLTEIAPTVFIAAAATLSHPR